MPPIRRLPEILINQIAAGEAVERPAAVVKELVENALDAGARSIEIAVEGGGRRLVRVADDGCGMNPEEARLALERHATSKIGSLEDLEAISTLGFRGEALPAIASVSRLTLTTAAADGAGHRLEIDGGRIERQGPHPHPRGTTVEVRDLFHHTPARAKFLRTAATELARLTEAAQALALAHPDVRFRLLHEGREIFQAPPAEGLHGRVRQIFGAELAQGLRPLSGGSEPLRVHGLVSGPAASRASRSLQFLLVNRRAVRDRSLAHAVAEACRPHIPRDRHPVLFLCLEVPAAQVDVNVHPAKREVRFRTPGAVHDLVRRTVEAALAAARPIPEAPAPPGAGPGERVLRAVQSYLARPPAAERPWRTSQSAEPPPASGREAAEAVPLPVGGGPRVLGQLRDTYILVEDGDALLLLDQHAAHERILYDAYRQEMRDGTVARQALLFPVTVDPGPAGRARLGEIGETLERLGFVVEEFGGGSLVVREVPAMASEADPARLLRDLAETRPDDPAEGPYAELEHRVAALAACHASVRAGMRLESGRMRWIAERILGGGHGLTCPHGRPAALRYRLAEIDRAFLRPA